MKKQMIRLMTLVIIAVFATSCATQPIPENPCKISFKQEMGMFSKELQFKGNTARYTGSMTNCYFVFWGCPYTETTIDKEDHIFVEGSGLFNSKEKVGKLSGTKVIFDETFLDSFAKVSDLEVSLKKKMVSRLIESKFIGAIAGKEKSKVRQNAIINNSCTVKEAAIGAITLFNARNAQI
jgi:hypothetical protein